MAIRYVDFEQVKTSVSIEKAAQMFGLAMKAAGQQLRGICPQCKSDDRSLVLTPAKQAYYCFKSKTGGDCISLAAHVKGIGMRDAAAFLAGDTAPQARAATAPTTIEGRSNGSAFDPAAYARGLNREHEALQNFGLTPAICERWNCGIASKGVLRGRLALAVCDTAGSIVAFIGRALDEPHYAYPNGFSAQDHIFGVDRLAAGEVRILADPVQVIVAVENGAQAIAFLTETVSPLQLEMLASILDTKRCEVVL